MLKKIFLVSFLFILYSQNILANHELMIWTSNEGAANGIRSISQNFEEKYHAKVIVEVLNKDLTALFKTAALTGKGPDILLWAHDVSGELAQSGLIEPIDENTNLTKDFLTVSFNAFRYKGRLYGYPYAVESIALFYNKDFVKSDPKSFEEIEKISLEKSNPKKNFYGFLYDFKNFFFSFPILNANGGYIFNEIPDGLDAKNIGITHSGFVDGLTFIKKLNQEGIIPSSTDRGIAFEHFKNNQLMFMIDGPWAIKDLNESKVHYKVIPLPTFKNKPARPFVGVQGFMIRRSSKNKLLAKEFIEKFLMQKTSVEKLYLTDKRLPARKDVLDELAQNNEQNMALKLSVESGIAMPNIPQMSSVWSAMGKAFGLCLDQNMDPRDSLSIGAKQIK